MPAADRPDGEPSEKKPGADEPEAGATPPLERSSRGRIIIRSSSHPPPDAVGTGRDVSGARALPPAPGAAGRSKRDTPAERPRRRRQIRIAATPERPRRDSPPGAHRLNAQSKGEARAANQVNGYGSSLAVPGKSTAATVREPLAGAAGADDAAARPALRGRIVMVVGLVVLGAVLLWKLLAR